MNETPYKALFDHDMPDIRPREFSFARYKAQAGRYIRRGVLTGCLVPGVRPSLTDPCTI